MLVEPLADVDVTYIWFVADGGSLGLDSSGITASGASLGSLAFPLTAYGASGESGFMMARPGVENLGFLWTASTKTQYAT